MKIIVAVPQRAPKDLAGAGLPGPQRCPCPDSWTVNTIHGRKDFAGVMKVMDFRIGRVFLDYLGGPVFVQLEGRCRRQREESERIVAHRERWGCLKKNKMYCLFVLYLE